MVYLLVNLVRGEPGYIGKCIRIGELVEISPGIRCSFCTLCVWCTNNFLFPTSVVRSRGYDSFAQLASCLCSSHGIIYNDTDYLL